MSQRNVAVIGASRDRRKYGNKSVRAHQQQGWHVFPIHPRETEIEGLPVYASVRDVPARIDRVSLYLPPSAGLTVLPDIAQVRPAEFFVNPGAESADLIEEARRLGLDPILACSIVDLGLTPRQLE